MYLQGYLLNTCEWADTTGLGTLITKLSKQV